LCFDDLASGYGTRGWATRAAGLSRSDFVLWHETDMPTAMRDVRSRGQSGKHILAVSLSGFDPGCVKTPTML
jgi:hypothetical protein